MWNDVLNFWYNNETFDSVEKIGLRLNFFCKNERQINSLGLGGGMHLQNKEALDLASIIGQWWFRYK